MKRDDLNGSPEQLGSRADAMNFVITSRSADLPAMAKVPLHVDLSNARTRACMGSRETGGIGGVEVAEGKVVIVNDASTTRLDHLGIPTP